MSLSNASLFGKVKECKFYNGSSILSFVLQHLDLTLDAITENDLTELKKYLDNFIKQGKKKWRQANRDTIKFEKKFRHWLFQDAAIPVIKTATGSKGNGNSSKPGRPSRDFCELSKRSRDRSTVGLREENDSQKLLHAAKISLRTDGNKDLAFVMDEAVKSPTRAKKLRCLSDIAEKIVTVPEKPISLPQKISPSDALAHILENDLTKTAYNNMKQISKEHHADIWPNYNKIVEAKNMCRPANIKYSENSVILGLFDRLKHNDVRFLDLFSNEIKELLKEVPNNGILKLESESKIGFDGCTGHSIYNQSFSLENCDTNESSLLSTCLVPLQYRTNKGYTIFNNPVPQSSSFCQPIRLEFRKETVETSKEIDDWIDSEVKNITPHIIKIDVENPPGEKFVEFQHVLKKTMLDCKAKNAVTSNKSAQKCFLCNAKPTDFNKLDNFPSIYPTIQENLQYGGVCDLHAWLRCFDGINSLSDKLEIKKWRRNKLEKIKVEQRKKIRQTKFKEQLGLIVDVPKAGGSGNTNTGNVARRAFRSEHIFSNITGVDQNLIHRIHIMLIAINTDRAINDEAFRKYGVESAALWVSLYPWYYMPVSIHQLFSHSHPTQSSI